MDKKFFQIISAACLLAMVGVSGFQSMAATLNDTDCCLGCVTDHVFCTDQYVDKFLGAELKSHKEKCATEYTRCTTPCPDMCEDLS